ncbi:hypothetical protein AGOR_G00041360 [Albula goreensis]|uniref:Uncharacterized protein n=1 Tax=Albula goreensis TaxID=1534307 RepID=A0A8T3DYU3_9TELE|nr:hypothetical protein AGOR_G00041360 [Albula goreensis]
MTRLQSTATTCSPLSPTTSSLTNSLLPQMLQYECEKCKMTFSSAKLWQEHQRMHLLANQNQFFHSQFLERSLEMPYVIFDPSNPLITSQLLSGTFSQMPLLNNTIHSSQPASGATSLKRKFDDREDNSSSDKDGANTGEDQHRDKRPRTTITPEQLEILYDKYLLDSNPTRKMLDHIANTVGLKKRVVQVWFQNTRARERKGQFRTMGTALSHKKCTFCGSLFKATSALESHIRSSHWHEAKEAGFNLLSSPMISFNEGGESQQRYDEILPTKVENIEYEAPKYEQPAASSSLVKPSEGQLKQFVNPSCAKAENNCDSEGFSFNSADASVDLIKMDFDETSSVTTVTSDVSTGYKGQSEPSESKTNLLQNYDSYREYQFNQANFSIQDSRQSCSMQSDDLDDSTDQSETWSVVDLSSPHPFSYRNPLEPTKLSIDRPGHRRSRTQMSNQQVMILKACFSDCRTPTMHECETLGDKIGLAKRVVQVWFQNARAKEKKFKITVGKPFVVSQDSPDGPLPECTLCGTRFTTTFPIREHIFSKLHVDKLQETLQNQVDREKDHLNPTTVRQLMAQHEFERYKKRAMDSLGTTVQPQTVRDGSASLGLTWPTGYSGITGLPSDINGPLKRPTFSQNTPAASPGDGSSQVTPSMAVSLSCTPAKNLLQTTPLPVSSASLTSQQAALQNLEKPKKSEQPKPQSKQREANGSHSDFKKMEEGEGGGRTARKTAQTRGLLNTVPGDPGTFLAGQFLPYFVPGLVPYLPPQLPGFAQSGTFPPLYGMENMFPYGPGLPQAIAGLSPAALVQQYQQYQQSLPDKLQQQKPTERQRQKPVHTKLSKAKIDRQQPKEENAGVSAESTDQDPQTGVRSTDSPDAAPSSSVRGKFTCEKCLTVFTDKESAAHHQESCRLGRSSSESELCKVESSKYNSLAQNLAISKNKELSQHAQSGPNKDKAVKQAMRDAKEHTRLPHTACSSTTSTSQSINNNRPHISCTSMASWPSVLFQASSMRATSFLSPSAPLPSPVSTPSMVTSPVRGTSESRLSLPAEICSDKLGGELSQKLDNIENSLDIKTKATSGLNSNFRSIRMNMFTV